MPSASKAQTTFAKIIEAGLYSHRRDPYMCNSLDEALRSGVIDYSERKLCIAAISGYMRQLEKHSKEVDMPPTAVISIALRRAHIITPAQARDRFADKCGRELYLNWDSRPVPA